MSLLKLKMCRIVCCCWISSRSRLTERGICSRICWTSSICNGIWLVVSKIYYFQYVSILKMYNPLIITILIGRSQRSNTFMETTNHIRSYFCFLCLKPTFWWVASDPRGRMFTGCFLLSSWPPWKIVLFELYKPHSTCLIIEILYPDRIQMILTPSSLGSNSDDTFPYPYI